MVLSRLLDFGMTGLMAFLKAQAFRKVMLMQIFTSRKEVTNLLY
jgi:hypothetical protein